MSHSESVITGIGIAVPPNKAAHVNTTEFLCRILQLNPVQKRIFKAIARSTGIKYRYSVLADYIKSDDEFDFFPNNPEHPFPSTVTRMNRYKMHALPLALTAIIDCLTNAGEAEASTITHIITVSCTGMYAPGLDIEILTQLKLPSSTKRTAINFMGCYGVFNALRVADVICQVDIHAKVLIVSVELCTLHMQKNASLDNMMSSLLFSDGAGAVLVENAAKHQNPKHLRIANFFCDILPRTSQDMTWHIGDSGFDISLTSYVPDAIRSGILELINKLLAQTNISLSLIDYFAIHPGGIKILQACEKSLNITANHLSHSYEVLQCYGNMSSCTILFVLKKIQDRLSHADHNKNIFCCAFGPGLTIESMLLRTHYV